MSDQVPFVPLQELSSIRRNLETQGYAWTTGLSLGLFVEQVQKDCSPNAVTDPRAPVKKHARDVLSFNRIGTYCVPYERESIAFTTEKGDIVDDFSRFLMLGSEHGRKVAHMMLRLFSPFMGDRLEGGMSADYFSYSPGAGTGMHQDKFGDVVAIWCTYRSDDAVGAVSELQALDGFPIASITLETDHMLIFRDDLFLHGVTELTRGQRDALICISLKEGM